MAVTADRRTDTLLGHCLVRAMLAHGVDRPEKATKWLAMKVTPKASRVTKFVVLWADAMRANGGEPIGIEAYVERRYSSRAKAYRDQAEFRELWREYETPNELASLLLVAVEKGEARKLSGELRLAL